MRPPDPSPLRATSVGLTHEGCVRDLNEDAVLTDDRRGLWGVADGMGGYALGDVASATVVGHLGYVRTAWPTARSLALDLVGRLEDANTELRALAAREGHRMIGSTVACLAVWGPYALALWCGDSRIYRLRDGRPIQRISQDHTLVQGLVDAGHLTEAEAESHPNAHVLTRGLGVSETFEPDFRQMSLMAGDRFILCSDGLSRVLPDIRIEAISWSARSPGLACMALLEAALHAGGPDNVTIAVIDFS
ncbi:MAG: protein phosphatase 2C domain-containing protein [Pseudomonadota bacterium]